MVIDSRHWTGRTHRYRAYFSISWPYFCIFFTRREWDLAEGERSDAYGFGLMSDLFRDMTGFQLYWGQEEIWLWRRANSNWEKKL